MTEADNNKIIYFYKKRVEPFIAIFILAFIIVCAILYWQDNQLKKEISNNCGWQEEKYKCYCDKSIVDEIENVINKVNDIPLGIGEYKNVSVVR